MSKYLVVPHDGSESFTTEDLTRDLAAEVESGDTSVFIFSDGGFEEAIVSEIESNSDDAEPEYKIIAWSPV